MFFSLQQSAFLHALGSAIGNSLWQLAALWLVFAAVSGVTKMNPANRYRLAVFFSTTGFLWFIVSFISKFINNVDSSTDAWNIYQGIDNPIVATGFSYNISFIYRSLLASLTSLSPYISCAYLLVWALLATRLVNGFRQVKQFGTQGLGKVNIDLKLFVQEHAALLQIQKKVKIFTSAYVQSPLTIGFFKPLILLPVASLSHLSTDQVEAILLHELAHIKRHDYLVNIFVQVAEITLFFNPFMRLLLKQIKQERENCCDDYVLQFQYNAADYAKALLGIAQNRTATLLAMGAKNNQFQLLNRVKRIVAPQPQTFNYRQQLYMLCLITILGLGITMIVPNSSAQPKKQSTSSKTIFKEKESIVAPVATTENTNQPLKQQPAAFDVVKTMNHFASSVAKMDVDSIENDAAEMESHGKEVELHYKQIAEKALKDAKPQIERANLFAKKFAEKMACPENQQLLKDGDIDAYISTVYDNANEITKQVSFQTNALPRPTVRPVAPLAPTPNVKIKIMRQMPAERKALLTKEGLEDEQAGMKKTMDSLRSAMAELGNAKCQEAINKMQATLAAIQNKENWDIAFNESQDLKTTSHITTIYTTKLGKMIKKMVNNITADIDIDGDDLNNIKIELKNEMDKLQSDKINFQFIDKHQERSHHKSGAVNTVTIADGNEEDI